MKHKLVVTSICDRFFATMPKTAAITDILHKWGYDYRPYVDLLWYGWPSKVYYYTDYVKTLLGEATHIMFIDSSDVVLLCGPDELMERWAAFDHPWVYNAEPHIWPPNSFTPEDYPTPMVNNRYINGGAYIGEVEHVAYWYDQWTQTPIVCEKSDQHWMAERFLKHWPDAIKLDTNCDLFQCMCGNDWNVTVTPGHLHNNMTGTDPAVIHFNGGTDITALDRRGLWDCLI